MDFPSLEDLHALGPQQQPSYPDPAAVEAAVSRLRAVPPLVFAGECDDLKGKLAAVARGEAFLLQGAEITRVPISEVAGKTRTVPRSLYDEVSVFFG